MAKENKAYILKSDGTRIDLDHKPTLSEAQKIVGGYIEFAQTGTPRVTLVVDEEGLLKGKPINKAASRMYNMYGYGNIVGDVIVLEGWKTVASDKKGRAK